MISLDRIGKILGCSLNRHLPIASYAIDSRDCRRGSLFFALKGEKTDGHTYLPEVAETGAFAAVVTKGYKGPSYGLELLFVDDVLESLHTLARVIFKERQQKVIAITGSVGKTTTKEFISALIEDHFKIFKTEGSRNTQLTFPLTILGTTGEEDYLVLEMGMTHSGNIKKLVSIAPPDIVVLTPIGIGHTQFHEDVESVAKAKCEIFTPKTEYAVIHIDSANLPVVQEECFCDHVVYPTDIGIPSPFIETHLTENFIGAAEVALHLGMHKEEILFQSKKLKPYERRFQKKMHEGILFIDDSYNANPISTAAALSNLPKPGSGGRKIFAFGAMGELGQFSLASHIHVGRIAVEKVDALFCIGEEARPLLEIFAKKGKEAKFYTCYQEMKEDLRSAAKEGDVVLVKGSKFHKLWELIDYI